MATTQKKAAKRASRTKAPAKGTAKIGIDRKRRQAIEKAISFWKSHSIALNGFKFNREEANAR